MLKTWQADPDSETTQSNKVNHKTLGPPTAITIFS